MAYLMELSIKQVKTSLTKAIMQLSHFCLPWKQGKKALTSFAVSSKTFLDQSLPCRGVYFIAIKYPMPARQGSKIIDYKLGLIDLEDDWASEDS